MKKFFISLICALLLTNTCLALTQNEKLWLGLNSQQVLTEDKKWLALIFTQFRLINKSHPWQATLLEGGIGYQWYKNKSVWMGYRWTAHNPNNGFYQENRVFQQIIWQIIQHKPQFLVSRTRIEEIERTDQSQIYFRLRQRLAGELGYQLFSNVFPFLFDEIFIPLNSTNFTSNKFINENRLFLGVNLYASKKSWWEIGYINQFITHPPQLSENDMSHIASITYNFL